MPTRPLAHRLLALVMGVLALQLTLWGASPSCAGASDVGSGTGHARMSAHAGMASVSDAGAGPDRVAADASPTDASIGLPVSAPAHCPMPLVSVGCGAQGCAAPPVGRGTPVAEPLLARAGGQAMWPRQLAGPTRSLVPDVPPPRA